MWWESDLYTGYQVRLRFKNEIVVQLLSHVRLFVTPWTAASDPWTDASPGIPVFHYLLGFTQIHVH